MVVSLIITACIGMILLIGIALYVHQLQMGVLGKEYQNQNHGISWNDGTIQGQVWGFLKSKGLNDIQVASIMGNIQQESGFEPSLVEAGNGIGYGLCQWSFGRRVQLTSYAQVSGKPISDIQTQLEFFWLEFSPEADRGSQANFQWIVSTYPYTGFMSATTIEEATTIFCHGWERCAVNETTSALLRVRIPYANYYYNLYKGTNGAGGGNASGSVIIAEAEKHLGKAYVWGATGPNTFDCSGLVYYVYQETGRYTGGRTTAAGYRAIATPITEVEAQPGDLVFFTSGGNTHHIGIYAGNGQMIHAPQTGDVVKYGAIWRTETVSFGRLGG